MVQELPIRNRLAAPFRYKRYFESKNNRIRIFGLCEVTGKMYEMQLAAEGFFVYLQGFQTITEALKSSTEEEREFILTGTSPEGKRILGERN